MKTLTMPDLSTRLKGPIRKRLKIPGGWKLNLPEATGFDPVTMKAYGRYFQTQGLSPIQAEAEVLKTMNKVFQGAWLRYIGTSVRYWARKYAAKFPANIQRDGTLKGFKPELLQNSYIPSKIVGRSGKVHVNKLLSEMNESAKDLWIDGPTDNGD